MTPDRIMPSARAALIDTSMTRPRTKGPRSLTRQCIEGPAPVTLTEAVGIKKAAINADQFIPVSKGLNNHGATSSGLRKSSIPQRHQERSARAGLGMPVLLRIGRRSNWTPSIVPKGDDQTV
jgi:hypothetical protein